MKVRVGILSHFQPGEGLLRECENRWIVCSSTHDPLQELQVLAADAGADLLHHPGSLQAAGGVGAEPGVPRRQDQLRGHAHPAALPPGAGH